MEGELQLLYYPDLISEERMRLYANDEMYYNDGVFPYAPKEIDYLDLAVGYNKDRDTMTVEVVDISFEPSKDKAGDIALFNFDEGGKPVRDEHGNFTLWQIVFHLGDVVKKDLRKER